MNRLQLSSGSFTAPVQHEKQEIHTVFLCFSYFPGKQNLSLSDLADLIRASLILPISLPESPLPRIALPLVTMWLLTIRMATNPSTCT